MESSVSLCVWNVNGWTNHNKILRIEILKLLDKDIICICESHLQKQDKTEIPGYTWYGLNRFLVHVRAPKGSGGVGIFVAHRITNVYNVSLLEKSIDGVLGILLQNKYTDVKVALFVCYLSPETSHWGRDSQCMFSFLTQQVYLLSDVDYLFILGEFNARLGNSQDIIVNIDDVICRAVIDKTRNSHGDSLVEFLHETKMCILNGRINPESNDYTSVTNRGKSVVDYIITRHDLLTACDNFKIYHSHDLIDYFDLKHLISNRCNPPDHAILSVNVKLSFYRDATLNYIIPEVPPSNEAVTEKVEHKKHYKFSHIPKYFMASESFVRLAEDVIKSIPFRHIDTTYKAFCELLESEMESNLNFNYGNKGPKYSKQSKLNKAYWDKELSFLWENMRKKEKAFKRFTESNRTQRRHLLTLFQQSRRLFDKNLRIKERAFKRKQLNHIEFLSTSKPNEFWKTLKQLGPNKSINMVPTSVLINQNIVSDSSIVVNKWFKDFSDIYKLNTLPQSDPACIHIKYIKTLIKSRENIMESSLYEENIMLNQDFLLMK